MHNVEGGLTDCVGGGDGAAGLLLTDARFYVCGQPLQPLRAATAAATAATATAATSSAQSDGPEPRSSAATND